MSRPGFPTLVMVLLAFALPKAPARAQGAGPDLREQASRALKKATEFYTGKVASHGGYVYYYSADLRRRWGEGEADPETIFVQPPGTPTVGMAYLEAHAATGDAAYLDAARKAAEALVDGQLESGGWTQTIHFGPAKRAGKYRARKGGDWNASSLDDGQTQAALRMLIAADQALGSRDARIHEATTYGLDALLKAQFPNGAFPQVWTRPVERKPVLPSRFPDYNWRTEGRVKNYWDCYTLNDNLAGTVADTLIAAHRAYKDDRFKAALAKLGDFLVLAQMPDPQPGWCQQYNFEMVPIWARKFEPPALTAWESQDVMETLIAIARHTGERKFLEPIPRALAYFKKRLLPDGRVARYYELGTDRPLFMDAEYRLTYDPSSAPTHYGWFQTARFRAIEDRLREARTGGAPEPARPAKVMEAEVRRIVRDLDGEGRWVSTYQGERLVGQPEFKPGFRYLSSEVFSRNVGRLGAYLAASR